MSQRESSSHPAADRRVPGHAVIRLARPDDVDAIRQIELASFENLAELFNRRQIASLIANPRATAIVVRERSGRILGWATGLVRRAGSGRVGRVYAIAVHPDGRGLGFGKRLMTHLLKAMRSRGAGRIFLEVRADNAAAIGLYRKLGFTDRQRLEHYYGRGLHGLRMVLEV